MKVKIEILKDPRDKLGQSKVGDIMIVPKMADADDQTYPEDVILLHTYSCIVNLKDPRQTWNYQHNKSFKENKFPVTFLPKGKSITLIIE